MTSPLRLLRSRFGHRLLALFVVCALGPTAVVALISLRNVTKELSSQAELRLHERSKAMGFAIFERLLILELNARQPGGEAGSSGDRRQSIVRLPDHFMAVEVTAMPPLDPGSRAHLAAGRSLLTTSYSAGHAPRLLLSRQVDPSDASRGLSVAEINPDFLWGLPDRTGLQVGTELTVLDESGQVLYSSTPEFAAALAAEFQQVQRSSAREFEWSSSRQSFLASYWSLFLRPTYAKSGMTVILSEPKTLVLAPIAGFKRTFLPILLLSLLIVVAIAIVQIRRAVEPLQALQAGTRRIAAQDFASPVTVTSGDEFERLAADFNAMAARLGRQFAELGQINDGLREQIRERELAERSLREAEAQLRQAQKMDAVGTLAGGVAHDFNNLLSVIVGYTELSLESLDQDAPLRADLEQVVKAANRATGLTRQLLAFSRKQVLQPEVLDLNELVCGVQKMLGRLIGAHIQIVTTPGIQPAWVHADRGQLDQILMNLAVNARDAMPEGGTLTIATGRVLLDASEAARLNTLPGACVVLSVRDSGTGMTEETRTRIFEPFFTTKPAGQGTGLGLSTVYGIVRQTGGAIAIESELGVGTTFRIHLPAVEAPAAAGDAASARPPEGRGTETVLLVEDEEAVRLLTRRMLEDKGYTVITAGDGEEALALSQQHEGPIHLLLTDVVMPRMGGKRLASHLRPRRPEMRLLFMSGYSGETTLGEDSGGQPFELLQKPFLPVQLTGRVRRVLDAHRADGSSPLMRPVGELHWGAP